MKYIKAVTPRREVKDGIKTLEEDEGDDGQA